MPANRYVLNLGDPKNPQMLLDDTGNWVKYEDYEAARWMYHQRLGEIEDLVHELIEDMDND